MSAECRKCGRDLDSDFKCGACECEAKLTALEEKLKVAREALEKYVHWSESGQIAKEALARLERD